MNLIDILLCIFVVTSVIVIIAERLPSLKRVKSVYYNNENHFWRVVTLTVTGAEEVWFSHNDAWIRQGDAALAGDKTTVLLENVSKRSVREAIVEHRRGQVEGLEE